MLLNCNDYDVLMYQFITCDGIFVNEQEKVLVLGQYTLKHKHTGINVLRRREKEERSRDGGGTWTNP